MTEVDRLIHEPARLRLLSRLRVVDEADFLFLERTTGLTPGNISSHMRRLEDAGYVQVLKEFVGRRPRTVYRLTDEGRCAFDAYRTQLSELITPPENPLEPVDAESPS